MPATVQRNLRVHLLRLARTQTTGAIRLPVQGGLCRCIKAPPVPVAAALWGPVGNEVVTAAQSAVLDSVLGLLDELSQTRWDGAILIEVVGGVPALPLWEFTDNLGALAPGERVPSARGQIRAVK